MKFVHDLFSSVTKRLDDWKMVYYHGEQSLNISNILCVTVSSTSILKNIIASGA